MNAYKIIRKAPALFVVINTTKPTFEVDGVKYPHKLGGYPVSRHRTRQSAQDLIDELKTRPIQ